MAQKREGLFRRRAGVWLGNRPENSSCRSRRSTRRSRSPVLDVCRGGLRFLNASTRWIDNQLCLIRPPGEHIPAADDIIRDLRAEAESLSDRLLAEEFPSYDPSPDKQADSRMRTTHLSLRSSSSSAILLPTSPQAPPAESGEEMRPSIMKRAWDERAKLIPMHDIVSNKVVWDEEDFLSGGAGDVERRLGRISWRSAATEQ